MTSFFAQLSFMHVVDHQQHGLSGGPSASTEVAKSSSTSITDEFAFRIEVDSKTSISASTPPKSKQKRFQSDLWTIRESPETVYTVAYIQMDGEDGLGGDDGGIPVPEVQPATPGVTIIEMSEEDSTLMQLHESPESNVEEVVSHDSDLNPKDLTLSELPADDEEVPKALTNEESNEAIPSNNETSESKEQDLKSLNERADRLCQELKRLNIEEQQSSTSAAEDSVLNSLETEDQGGETQDFKEIMRQYSDFIIIMRSEDDALEEKYIEDTDVDTSEQALIEDSNPKDHVDAADNIDKNNDNGPIMVEENKATSNIDDDAKSTKEDADLQNEAESNDQMEAKETKTEMECDEPLTNEASDVIVEEQKENKIEEHEAKNNIEEDEAEQKTCQSKNDDEQNIAEMEFQEALDKLQNFKPKRPRLPTSQFPDLSVEGETMARTKSNGSLHYWRMPFRHELFDRERRLNDDDP